jgi:hypothetical protein
MALMRRRAALALGLALALASCANEEPTMPSTCTDTDQAGYVAALRAAPNAVRLSGGTSISTCLERVRTDAELQNLGGVVHAVAERLAAGARGGDVVAARELGYLNAAVAAGAERSNGIAAELARRVSVAGTGLAAASPAVARALAEGQAAGAARK